MGVYNDPVLINYIGSIRMEQDQTLQDCCSCKTKERSEAELRNLYHRLNRIEGQIRGIKGMLDRDAYCIDILTQVAAVTAALNGFSRELLADHIKTCVASDLREGKDETIDELIATMQKLMR